MSQISQKMNPLEGDVEYGTLQELQLPASIVTVSSTNSSPALTFLLIIQTATTTVKPIGERRLIASSILLPTSSNDCSLSKLLRKPKHLTSNRNGY